MNRVERRRLEKQLAEPVRWTPRELELQRRFRWKHPRLLKRHFSRHPANEAALLAEAEAVRTRRGIATE